MSYVRDGIDAHVNEYIEERLESPFTEFHPLFYFLGLTKPDQMNKLGRPNTAMLFGGARMGSAQIEELAGSKNHQFRFVKSAPNDGAAVSFGGATPTASAHAEDNFGTAETRWTHFQEPLKVRKHSLEMAKGSTAVGALLDEVMVPTWDAFRDRINTALWTGTRTQAQQNDEVWGTFLGLQHTGTEGNYYGRVDRAVETNLNPLYLDASTELTDTVIDLKIVRQINNGFTDAGSTVRQGLAGKSRNGVGAACWITTPTLWQELADQSDGRFQIYANGIPNTAIGGFNKPIIHFDNSYITYDDDCPSGELYGLNLDYWVFEIMSGHNFVWTGFTDKSRTEEGGEYIEWGDFDLIARLTCRAPWKGVARVANLTSSQ